ncbi:glycosyltransferase [Aliikangiella maris]|uniref:Glycosyltransferase n=2 Tax=Aliikangiella maris TaxID=3162458 RepID=A0ABV2BRT3_9GAMM
MIEVISIIIRTYNESRYLNELLCAIENQITDKYKVEVVLVDSGSSDNTLDIAKKHQVNILHIDKEDFTFGRSLNLGCHFASGKYLVFISGHCVPSNNAWLVNLVNPLKEKEYSYVYGRQIGRDTTKFSEYQLFKKYFPENKDKAQGNYFCNNANAAINKSTWEQYYFDESLTGLEDLELAKRIFNSQEKIGYVENSCVYHIHNESWTQVKRRYEREALALQKIMPEIHFNIFDMFKYIFVAIYNDTVIALRQQCLIKEISSIVKFRFFQYWGAYKGNRMHRKLSRQAKLKYFYPKNN